MGAPLWVGLLAGALLLGAWFNYFYRVERIILGYNGFQLGFATRNMALGFHTLDRSHPQYPPGMDEALAALAWHRNLCIAAIALFAAFVTAGAFIKFST